LELKMPAIRAFFASTESRTAPNHARKLSHVVRVCTSARAPVPEWERTALHN
jgi:hypothetical protein